jgi:ribosomal protein S18 acetylase RimI-like enzyme
MSTFRIRPATSFADIATVTEMFKAYAASLDIDLYYQDFSTELAAMPGKYAPPMGALLLAKSETGEQLGCVGLRPMLQPGCCEMKRLYVTQAGRGLGLGQALIDAVIGEARRIGYRHMRLDTLPSMTQAIALYKKAGFTPIAPYYDTAPEGTLFFGNAL